VKKIIGSYLLLKELIFQRMQIIKNEKNANKKIVLCAFNTVKPVYNSWVGAAKTVSYNRNSS
jgi:hypothetical protein